MELGFEKRRAGMDAERDKLSNIPDKKVNAHLSKLT